MTAIQSIHAFLHCPRRRMIWLVVLLAVSGLFIFWMGPRDLAFPDAMEYADAARGWARGDGMLDRAVWVYQLNLREGVPSPMMRRAILFPLVEGVVFRILGATDRTAIATSLLCFLASVFMVYQLAGRIMPHSPHTGLMLLATVLWCLVDTQQIQMAVSGLSEPLFTCFVIGAAIMLTRPLSPRGCLALGAVIGLSQWVRLNGFLLLLPAILAQWAHYERFPVRNAVFTLLGAAPFLLILAVRNLILIGDFSFVGMNSAIVFNGIGGLTEHGIERRLYIPPATPPTMSWVLSNHAGAFAQKLARGLELTTGAMIGGVGPLKLGAVAFGSAAAWRWLPSPQRAVTGFAAGIALLWVPFFAAGEFEGPRFFVPLSPLVIVMVVSVFGHLRANLEKTNSSISHNRAGWSGLGVLFVLLIAPQAIRFGHEHSGRKPSGVGTLIESVVKKEVSEGSVVMTDLPWAVAWYADRPAVYLPRSVGEAPVVAGRTSATHVFLTSWTAADPELDPSWRAVYESGAGRPAGWRPMPAQTGMALFQINVADP